MYRKVILILPDLSNYELVNVVVLNVLALCGELTTLSENLGELSAVDVDGL